MLCLIFGLFGSITFDNMRVTDNELKDSCISTELLIPRVLCAFFEKTVLCQSLQKQITLPNVEKEQAQMISPQYPDVGSFKLLIFWQEWAWMKILIQNIIRFNHQNQQMSSHTQNVSPLSLLKVASNTSKCYVFCELGQTLERFQISIDDSTSVSNLIDEAILLIKNTQRGQGVEREFTGCELYASKKNGSKISDLPSLSGQQKILKTGIKRFYLEFRQKSQKKKTTTGSLSTKSISSQIVIQKREVKEKKATKQFGCFCFA